MVLVATRRERYFAALAAYSRSTVRKVDENMPTWPEELFDFAFIHNFNQRLDNLAALAEPEAWDYQNTAGAHHKPILFNYLKYTYSRLAEEEKIELSAD